LIDVLAGIKVLHGLDKVMGGGAVVLTLKDQNILSDGDLNEGINSLVFSSYTLCPSFLK
jgi:U4/U6.U5 tri-snRNP-associated protein 1